MDALNGWFSCRKKACSGHKVLVNYKLHRAKDLLIADPLDIVWLAQTKMSLQEKLTVVMGLDAEIVKLDDSEDAVMKET